MRKPYRLGIERLEDRVVPSVTARLISGSLYITGTPNGELDITRVSGPTFSVTDDGSSVGGPYNITSNLSVTLKNRLADVKIDLNGGTINGNVIMDLGAGYVGAGPSSVDIYDDSMLATPGKIKGSVSILRGNGEETINIGAFQDNGAMTAPVADPIVIGGSLTLALAKSNSSIAGDLLNVDAGTKIVGSVTASQVDDVRIGNAFGAALTTVGLDVTANDVGSLRQLQVSIFGSVGRNVNVTGTTKDDQFTMQQFLPGGGVVKGSVTINMYDGLDNGDQVLFGPNTTVAGSVNVTTGDNTNTDTGDQISLLGNINLNATIRMGNSTNSLYFGAQNPLLGDPTPFVGGSMTVTAGSGDNIIGTNATQAFSGKIVHNLSITLGSGDNGDAINPSLDPMIICSMIGGTFTWHSGDGQNFLQLGNFANTGTFTSYNVNILFGGDDDTFILDIGGPSTGPGGILTGRVNGGSRVFANHYIYMSGVVAASASITNFP